MAREKKGAVVVYPCNHSLKQGVRGKVVELRGNQMPSPDGKPKSGIGVQREIGIFERTTLAQVEEGAHSGFYKNIKTKEVKITKSDTHGCFVISLKPGNYSLFVREEGEWYANSISGDSDISLIEIRPDSVSEIEFKISYKAFF